MEAVNIEEQRFFIDQIQQISQTTKQRLDKFSDIIKIADIKNNIHLIKLDLMKLMIAVSCVEDKEWQLTFDKIIALLIKKLFDFYPPTNLEAFAYLVKAYEDKLPASFRQFLNVTRQSTTDELLSLENIEKVQPHYKACTPSKLFEYMIKSRIKRLFILRTNIIKLTPFRYPNRIANRKICMQIKLLSV